VVIREHTVKMRISCVFGTVFMLSSFLLQACSDTSTALKAVPESNAPSSRDEPKSKSSGSDHPDTKAIFDIHKFLRKDAFLDGANPYSGLEYVSGNLFGTTFVGGLYGYGTIFELSPSARELPPDTNHRERVLYAFAGEIVGDGQHPTGTLISDANGVLYGTTSEGGGGCKNRQDIGCGTIFALQPGAQSDFPLLHSFAGAPLDGSKPQSGLVSHNGVLYGTTQKGGTYDSGIVYRIHPDGTGYTILHVFQTSRTDGAEPIGAPLLLNGKVYGVAAVGGKTMLGVLFSLVPSPSAPDLVLHNFPSFAGDGETPVGTLVTDQSGNLYGTTFYGGRYTYGMVFKINPSGSNYQDIYDFRGPPDDGANPMAGLAADGNVLYGTTEYGGNGYCPGEETVGCGTLFALTPSGSKYAEAFVLSFLGSSVKAGGAYPHASVVVGDKHVVYGTTAAGGGKDSYCPQGCGRVFRY
jgi:uncharacterized repeat protein (TIGR03803 family)